MKRPDLNLEVNSGKRLSIYSAGKWLFLVLAGGVVWEFVFDPLVRMVGVQVLTVFSSLSHEYLNRLYRGMASLYFDNLVAIPAAAIVFGVMAFLVHMGLKLYRDLSDIEAKYRRMAEAQTWDQLFEILSEKDPEMEDMPLTDETLALYKEEHLYPEVKTSKRASRRFRFMLLPLIAVLVLVYAGILAHLTLLREGSSWVHRSVQIVSPFVEERQRLALISDFRRIETAEQFFVFKQRLASIAQAHEIRLPSITFIGEPSTVQK